MIFFRWRVVGLGRCLGAGRYCRRRKSALYAGCAVLCEPCGVVHAVLCMHACPPVCLRFCLGACLRACAPSRAPSYLRVVLCCAVLCHAVTVPCCAVPCRPVPCRAAPRRTTPRRAAPCRLCMPCCLLVCALVPCARVRVPSCLPSCLPEPVRLHTCVRACVLARWRTCVRAYVQESLLFPWLPAPEHHSAPQVRLKQV